jgi:hypothetical protein
MVDGAAAAWADALGTRVVKHWHLQTLDVPSVDPSRWEVTAPAGCRWRGRFGATWWWRSAPTKWPD